MPRKGKRFDKPIMTPPPHVKTPLLFEGSISFAGLSNERELAKLCPAEFRKPNRWSRYAMKIFYSGGSTANWKWRSDNPEERGYQRKCWVAILSGFDLSHEDKTAVSGWMLSEMLTEVPA
jgi:hypothetical protein